MSAPQHNPGYADPSYLQMLGEYVVPLKQRSYELMHLMPGQRVLDVGCGPATDTLPLANRVGAEGQVIGVDYDDGMVTVANQMADEAGVADRVTHRQADAAALPYPDHYFDSTRSERLFQHLKQAELALAEMMRVTKPGGRVVVVDTDWGSLAVDTANRDLMWRIARSQAQHLHNGYSGRRLYRFFKEQQLEDVEVEIYPLIITDYGLATSVLLDLVGAAELQTGVITQAELDSWHTELQQLGAQGMFFAYVNIMIVVGRKPG